MDNDNNLYNDSQYHKIFIDKFSDIGVARVDHNRIVRQTVPEVIYAPGKTPEDCALILTELLDLKIGPILITRANQKQIDTCSKIKIPSKLENLSEDNNIAYWLPREKNDVLITIVTAGTADIAVAKECEVVLNAFGLNPSVFYDCGVAGIDRILSIKQDLIKSKVVVVVAGMEGALVSVVAGMVACPVIGVPTSVGYGSSLKGVTALLSMLSSCSPGVCVVGIDNGFGAACASLRFVGGELRG